MRAARREYCEVCGREVENREDGSVHHIVHRSRRGPDHEYNLLMMCNECHRNKAHKGEFTDKFLFGIVADKYNVSIFEVERVVTELTRRGEFK